MKTDSEQTAGAKRRMITLFILLLLGLALACYLNECLVRLLTDRHPHLDRSDGSDPIRYINVMYFVFLVLSAWSLLCIAAVRFFSRRNTRLDYWLFAVPVIISCLYLLAPLTCGFVMMIDYANTGITLKRVQGLLFGIGGYAVILGFLWWSLRMPKRIK